MKLGEADLSLLAQPVKRDGRLVFSGPDPHLAGLAPGAVLYAEKSASAPLGLVARVKSVTLGATGGMEIETTPARLAEAFSEFHIFIDNRRVYFLQDESDSGQVAAAQAQVRQGRPGTAGAESAVGLLQPQYLAEAMSPESVVAGTWSQSFDFDTMLENEDCCSIELNSGLELSLTGEVNLSYSGASVSGGILFTPVLTGSATVTAAVTGSIGQDNIDLMSVDGTFWVGVIPVTVSVDLVGGYGVEGTITGTISGQATVRGTGGFSFSLGLGVPNFVDIVRCPNSCPNGFSCGPDYSGGQTCSLRFDEPSASWSVDNGAYVYVEPRVGLGPGLSFADAQVTVGMKYQLEAKIEPPDINFYAELIPDVGADITAGFLTWPFADVDLAEVSERIWQISEPAATTGSAMPVAPTAATLNGTVNPSGAVTQYWFLYATNSSLSGATKTPAQTLLIGSNAVAVSANRSGLAGGTTYYYQLQASNFRGTGSGSTRSFNTPTTVVAPTITSVGPDPMTGSSSNQALTVSGSGFQSGLTLTVGYPGFSPTLSGTQITSVSSTQIGALINVGTTARPWSVKVNNPGGQSSNTAYWNVTAQ